MTTAFGLGLGTGLIVFLVVAAAIMLLPAFAVPFPIVWPGFAMIAFLIIAVPFIITGIVSGLLGTAVSQVLTGLQRLLESPVALPPAISEAFGELVPTTMMLDDLDAGGVLRTPTSPWAVIPMISKRDRPPTGGDQGGHPPPPITSQPVPPGTPVPFPEATPHSRKK